MPADVAAREASGAGATGGAGLGLVHEVRRVVDTLDLPFNPLGIDPYGVSKAYLVRALVPAAFAYRHYFSVQTRGIGNVPPRGRVMLVGNHAGGVALDAVLVIAACLLEMKPPRLAHAMAERFVNRWPIASLWASRTGQFMGLPQNAERLLEDDRLLLVFPEGARGTAKLFPDRHTLVAFGSGFMRLALKTRSPIVPVAVLGTGDAFPTIANLHALGRLVGVPYVPVPAYGVPFVLPAKVEIEFGASLAFEGTGNEDDDVVFGYVRKVREAIGRMLAAGVRRRRGRLPPEVAP